MRYANAQLSAKDPEAAKGRYRGAPQKCELLFTLMHRYLADIRLFLGIIIEGKGSYAVPPHGPEFQSNHDILNYNEALEHLQKDEERMRTIAAELNIGRYSID
jgi:hypothetical protein